MWKHVTKRSTPSQVGSCHENSPNKLLGRHVEVYIKSRMTVLSWRQKILTEWQKVLCALMSSVNLVRPMRVYKVRFPTIVKNVVFEKFGQSCYYYNTLERIWLMGGCVNLNFSDCKVLSCEEELYSLTKNKSGDKWKTTIYTNQQLAISEPGRWRLTKFDLPSPNSQRLFRQAIIGCSEQWKCCLSSLSPVEQVATWVDFQGPILVIWILNI